MLTTVYQTDAAGYYLGETVAQPSPLEPGVLLMPAGAVAMAPPAVPAGSVARWTGADWTIEADPAPGPGPDPEPDDVPLDQATLSPKQWLWALRAFGLRAPLTALVEHLETDDPDLAGELEARAFGGEGFERADVDALLADHAAAIASAAPALAITPAQLDVLWAQAAAKTF